MAGNIINEDLARTAKNANSFSGYKAGSATASYRSQVNSFESRVDDLIKKHPENYQKHKDKIDSLRARHSSSLARAINEKNAIDGSVPSIMIAGGSNFNVRAKERQNARRGSWFEKNGHLFSEDDNYYLKRITGALTNNAIYSDEADADKQLADKINKLKISQEEMKEANAYYRKHKTMKGYKNLSNEKAKSIDAKLAESIYGVPYPSFELSGNNANIRRLQGRLDNLKKQKQKPKSNYKTVKDFEIVENTDLMRLQILFDGKPDEKTREQLKKNGFRWSPTAKAWQRQLTENAKRSTKWFIEDYLKINPSSEILKESKKPIAKKDTVKPSTAKSYDQLKSKGGSLKPKKKKAVVESKVQFSLDENKMPEYPTVSFRPYRRTKSGKIIYAKDYGKKVFKFG